MPLRGGFGSTLGSALRFFLGIRMTTKRMRHRLECLGWEALSETQQSDGRWSVWATSYCHAIFAIADNRHDVWSAACEMAMKLTREERFSLPP